MRGLHVVPALRQRVLVSSQLSLSVGQLFLAAGQLFLAVGQHLVAAHQPRQKSKAATFLTDFRDLAVGDYVVHVEHGIGQYLGLKEIIVRFTEYWLLVFGLVLLAMVLVFRGGLVGAASRLRMPRRRT